MDAVPGRYSTAWFEAKKTGRYHLFCTEYCGAEHSLMVGEVVVMEPQDYEAWLQGSLPEQSIASSGAELFESKACNTCHRTDSDARAPILVGVYGSKVRLLSGEEVEADDSYIRESIMTPSAKVVAGYQPIMPTYKSQLSEDELRELINYIKSLGEEETPSGASGAGTQTSSGE
jgi:cytochrome c oxidase subunit 2